MPTAKESPLNAIMQHLPSVDEMLRTATARSIAADSGERHTADLARRAVASIRQHLLDGGGVEPDKNILVQLCEDKLREMRLSELTLGTRRVINATGVVIHTNLGRAPLSQRAREAVLGAMGYCTLEYNINTGKRGKRGNRAEDLLSNLTGAEDTLIVNNCAAAAFFVLTVFAAGGEVVVSRGELVEIGGDFRVPDVLAQSGSTLCEVGTTNRTKLADYEKAINSNTRLILRVHPSNYKIVGFTAAPAVSELADLAHRHGLMLYEDLGSGALIDLSVAGLSGEPVANKSIAAGADLVTFSGDKLLGGPQAGIIAGKVDVIQQLRSQPLYRALRADKLTYAALEATLTAYVDETAFDEVPVLRMMALTKQELTERAHRLSDRLKEQSSQLGVELVSGESAVGGGAAPAVKLDTTLIALNHDGMSAQQLEQALRSSDPPVISRIVDGRVTIDLRTVSPDDESDLADIFGQLG